MTLENKLNIANSAELALEEEKISKKKAIALFQTNLFDKYVICKFSSLKIIHKFLF